MISESTALQHFKEYAQFCLNQKFDDLCADYLLKLKEFKDSSRSIFSLYTEDEIKSYCRLRLEVFLKNAIEDSLVHELQLITQFWTAKDQNSTMRIQLPEEVIWDLAARKNSLLNYLPAFSNDLNLCLLISRELSLFHLLLEEEVFKSYIKSQRQEIETKNLEMKELSSFINREVNFINTVIDHSSAGIVAFDTDLIVTKWNKTLERLNKLPRELVLGRSLFELFPSYESEKELFVSIFNKQSDSAIPHKHVGNSYEMQIVPLHDLESKEVIGGVAFVKETLTEKTNAEKLKQKDTILKEIQQIAHLGSWEWLIRSNQLICTEEVYKILGYQINEVDLTVDFVFSHFYQEDEELIRAIINHSFNSFRDFNFEIRVKRKDGNVRYLQVKGKVLTYRNSVPYKMVGIAWDITDRKETEEALFKKNHELAEKNDTLNSIQDELRSINDDLEERVIERTKQLNVINGELNKEIAERAKVEEELKVKNMELLKINGDLDNFVYTASHDLKSPISNIEGLINTLSEELKDLSDENRFMIEMIKLSIIKFKDTINDLTEITKTQKNLEEQLDLIDLKLLLEEIKISIKDLIINSRARILYEGNEFSFRFSKANLKSILYNLLSNAIKYRHPERNPEIRISCSLIGEYVSIHVKDNGLGINPEQKEKVFTMFKRLHDHVEGSGVGLYLVKRIVDNNGGLIEVESEEGIGSEFKVLLKI